MRIDPKELQNKLLRIVSERSPIPVHARQKYLTGLDACTWADKMATFGAGEILLTSMDRDGTKNGYDLKLTRAISDRVAIPVIASGGVGNPEHIYEGLATGNASAALAASIFHYREFTIQECKTYLKDRGIPVRMRDSTR